MSETTYELSPHAHARLTEEYQYLTTAWRIEIARKIETAREMGDLSENGDYHAAKEEQGKTEARIGHLKKLLEHAVIIETVDSDVVGTGALVTVIYEGDDEEETYLVGMIEEKRPGVDVISPTSPMGSALLGSRVGDTVTFEAPSGTLSVEIVRIGA